MVACLAHRRAARSDKLDGLACGCGAGYRHLSGNDVFAYADALREVRRSALAELRPVIVEIEVKTLGDWRQPTEEFPDGKYINYHAGPAPTVEVASWPVLGEGDADPLRVLLDRLPEEVLKAEAATVLARLQGELA